MFNYEASQIRPGKTVPLKMYMLPGKPTIHVEHLGESNPTFWVDQIARANSKDNVDPRRGKLTKKAIREAREKNRTTLAKHAIRRLEAKRADGTRAHETDDIQAWIESIPDDVVDQIRDYVLNADNFRDYEFEDAEDIAEK